MTHSIQYFFSHSAIDEVGQRIFAPIVGALHLHSASIVCGGNFNVRGFSINHPWISVDNEIFGYRIEESDEIYIAADYFYKKTDNEILSFLVGENYPNKVRTNQILSSHYIDGHFAIDNGLYKEAVFNFGTVIEALVNTDLKYCRLEQSIKSDLRFQGCEVIKENLLYINSLRNRVHPEQICNVGEITREDALHARFFLQDIIFWFYKNKVS